MLEIVNDGPAITSTNYWETDYARAGEVFLSLNAGCFRLLLPEALEREIAEMATAGNVIVSRGPWPDGGKADAIELLFDDVGQLVKCSDDESTFSMPVPNVT
jgi:hypothetical protein